MNISELDPNLGITSSLKDLPGVVYLDPEEAPFKLYGVFREGDHLTRVPTEVAKQVSPGVEGLSLDTAGGRIRFRTDSPYVAVKVIYNHILETMPHMAATGSKGVDIYEEKDGRPTFVNAVIPPVNVAEGYEGSRDLLGTGMHEVTLNLPLYQGIKKIYVGLDGGSRVYAPKDYSYRRPILYYGSSITQGGCASRPGLSYQAMLTRWLDCDHINLGFSGNARAEVPMVDYLTTFDASVFVCDYDHNAPSADFLKNTHKPLYLRYRERRPDTPIVFVSRPKFLLNSEELRRREIIRAPYEDALAAGDKRVYFIDGATLTAPGLDDEGTVDHCHPNDLGFYYMAKGMYPVLKQILEGEEK